MYTFEEVKAVDSEIAEAIQLKKEPPEPEYRIDRIRKLCQSCSNGCDGQPLTNKYAEGYPGKRYYGGCQYVDIVENLAIERAKKLFGAHMSMFSHTQVHRLTWQYFRHS